MLIFSLSINLVNNRKRNLDVSQIKASPKHLHFLGGRNSRSALISREIDPINGALKT